MNMKGSSCVVDPIRSQSDILEIKELLRGSPRDYALFCFGVNVAFRASDLLALKVGQVRGLSPGDDVRVKEKKTSKYRAVTLNRVAWEVIQPLLTDCDDDYLFRSGKTGGRLRVETLIRMVKEWCRKCGVKGHFGSHTLRKTWGYNQRVVFGVEWEKIRMSFGHSSILTTQHYLGIQPEEIRDVYMNEI